MPTPILLLSDSPDLQSGLARITRDLAYVLSSMPEFRVGTLGRGGLGSSRLPWAQYNFPESDQWGEGHIEHAWADFSRGQRGVIFTVWDATRLLWFGHPVGLPPSMSKFLGPQRNFEKWGYFMLDSTGPDGNTLPLESKTAMQGFDRVLIASEWGAGVVRQSGVECDWLPHGINTKIFERKPDARAVMEIDDDAVVMGSVMTNQSRKDWPIAFDTARILKERYGSKFLFWLHTDTEFRYWNASSLAADYGVVDCTRVTLASNYDDKWMAHFYSACDVTILPSGGEGFGYPVVESMSCGTPCVVGDYAAAPELVDGSGCLAQSIAFRVDTWHNVMRAVYHPSVWADRADEQITRIKIEGDDYRKRLRDRVEHLEWKNLHYPWAKWIRNV